MERKYENTIKLEVSTKPILKITDEAQIYLDKHGRANIKSKLDFETAGEIRNQIRSYLKSVEEARKLLVSPLNDAKDAVQEAANKIKGPLELALGAIDRGMLLWKNAEDKRIKDINDRKMKDAEEKAEKERLELEKKAEVAHAAGNEEKAEQIKAKAQEVFAAPVTLRTSTKVAGFAVRKTWKGIVEDFSKLPDDYKVVNQAKLNEFARATAGNSPVPGVIFKEEESTTGAIK